MILFLYIVKDILFPYLLSVGVISSILLMERIFHFLPFFHAAGLELNSVVQMMGYSLMPVLTVSIPLSMIVGVYAGLNRFSSDSELVVMRASGVSISFLYRPVLFVAILVSLLTSFIVFYLCPVGLVRYEILKYNILKKHTKIQLSANRINDLFGQKLIYIFEKEDDLLKGIFIANNTQPESEPIIEAREGRIFFDEQRQKIVFRLYDGKMHHFSKENNNYRTISYQNLEYDIAPQQKSRPELQKQVKVGDDGRYNKGVREMTIFELFTQSKALPDGSRAYYSVIDELNGRFVTVFSVICFAIFMLPMGVVNPRSPKTGKFIYMFLLLLLYFLLYARARALLVQGRVPPITVYVPLFLAVYLGLINYYKLNNDIPSITRYWFGKLTRRKTAG